MNASMPDAATTDDPRFQIALARRILYREGLDSQIGGHVSLRVPGEDAFLVTPYQYFDETLPEHVMKVGFDLRLLEAGTLPPAVGTNFHASVYRSRPDVNCVIHTHGFFQSVLSTTGRPFDTFYDYASLFLDDVAYWNDDTSLTPEREGDLMAEALGSKRVMLMGHHGALHVGDTLENAVIEAIVFELSCRYQVAAMQIDGKPLDRASAESYRHAYLTYGFRRDMWAANVRRSRRSDPDLWRADRADG